LLDTVVNALETRRAACASVAPRQITQAPPVGTRTGFLRAHVAPTLATV
jgi:hypothetical protein